MHENRRLVVSVLAASVGFFSLGMYAGYRAASPGLAENHTDRTALNRDNVLVLVNEARLAKGLRQLGEDPRLDAAAQDTAQKLEASRSCSHDYFRQRREAGDQLALKGAEILNCGSDTATQAVKNFLDSPTHADGVLDPETGSMGIGISGTTLVVHFLRD